MATATASSTDKLTKDNLDQITDEPAGSEGELELDLPGNVTIELSYESEVEHGKNVLTAIGQAKVDEDTYSVGIGDLVHLVAPEVSLPDVLTSIKLEINYLVISYEKGADAKRKWLLGVDLSLTAPDLSTIPVLGPLFKDLNLKLTDDLLLLYASDPYTKTEIDALNKKLPEKKPKISVPKGTKDATVVIHQGINVSGNLSCSAEPELMLPGPKDEKSDRGGSTNDATDAGGSELTLWFKVQKKLGPINIDKIGVGFNIEKLELDFLMNAGLEFGGFSLALEEFSIGSPLTKLEPKLDFKGIAIDFSAGTVELSGGLAKMSGTDDQGQAYTNYIGELKIAIGDDLTILGIASFAEFDQTVALFGYFFVGVPIPVFPPDFVISGFALGLGFNQSVKAPEPNDVNKFPLVTEVMPGAPSPKDDDDDDEKKAPEGKPASAAAKKKGAAAKKKKQESEAQKLLQEFTKLNQYISPNINTYFGAVGVRGGAVEMIDAFALLIVEGGNRFEIDLMGLASATLPVAKPGESDESFPTLAYVGLSILATIAPTDGYMGIAATITDDSYILDPDIKPSGGFAAYSWWGGEHAGDFVVTVGGYNPYFDTPSYYPTISRCLMGPLPVPPPLWSQGKGYFALCAHALMAGIEWDTIYPMGPASVTFAIDADVLIGWKPFHYDLHVGLDIHLSAQLWIVHLSLDVGADLHIWGPDFSGSAGIQAGPFWVGFTFGAAASVQPQPIDWQEFKDSFLPQDDTAVCTLKVSQGLIKQIEQDDGSTLLVVNPKELRLSTDSLIPSKQSAIGGQTANGADGANTHFGIAPMALSAGDLETVQTINVSRTGVDGGVEDDFTFTPILRRFPTGMWGNTITPELNGPRFVENALAGFTMTPKKPPEPGETHDIATKKLQFDPTTVDYRFESTVPFEGIQPTSDQDQLLAALGF